MKTITIKNTVIGEGMPKLIVPMTGKNDEEIIKEIQWLRPMRPDIIEWRADYYEKVEDVEVLLSTLDRVRRALDDEILLFTFRRKLEGGQKEVSADVYQNLIETVIKTKKPDMVDIELLSGESIVRSLVACARAHGVKVVMSNHDFHKTPPKSEIIDRLSKMQALGADVPKIAVMANSMTDVLTLWDAANTMKEKLADRPFIALAMGDFGIITRLAGGLFGSAATFGVGLNASAPGQLPVSEVRTVLEILHKYEASK
ncbi:type I 3-dehydroquinate dehydratase [Tuberibacillus calidus]|uniref:type I 3-dehydroquinate dehydratase n=1 Tax=Tuberibacillus calidus TaxID=340097 RepID=UPI0004269201|nr:type I 3-dehydroquinate dehydratase [Tuberibacillus calidus]